jgi:glutaminase
VNLDKGDYDQRTPMHLASASGHLDVVKYLVEHKFDHSPRDRWGATPLNDAHHQDVKEYLESIGAGKGVD